MHTILSAILLALIGLGEGTLPPTCQSDIFCYGPLLHAVQMASIYPDSKTFVDMKMKFPRNETLALFDSLMEKTHNNPTRDDLENFLNDTFDPAGSEFEDWDPSDWIEKPTFLSGVRDRALQDWGSKLNGLWKFLGRKMKDEVKENPELYSIIYVPHPVIVPGGRFREFYYWDSYWIVRGLLLSEMTSTVKGMLQNFISIVKSYGFIPNGGRLYFTMRSQPPLLIPMVATYVETTKDEQFLKDNIDVLEQEFNFWLSNHTVQVNKDGRLYTLAIYKDASSGPRPESYREDYVSAQLFKTEEEREVYYSELKSAAESGWDFSSRWFITNGTNKGSLTDMHVKEIIPVDLNAIIYWNADLLSKFYSKLGDTKKALEYTRIAENWMDAVTKILWNEEVGAWLDYDMLNEIPRNYFYPTNIAPLWTNCYEHTKSQYHVEKVLKYLERSQVLLNLGGVPTTLEHTGEQWDYPNAWPPLQYIMIMGLDATDNEWAKRMAYEMSEKWIRSNYKAFNETNAMYEKYDATVVGATGGGGEYVVQLGFGWTNGVIMELLSKYGDRLTAQEPWKGEVLIRNSATMAGYTFFSNLFTVLFAFFATMSAGCIGLLVYSRRYPTKYMKLPQF